MPLCDHTKGITAAPICSFDSWRKHHARRWEVTGWYFGVSLRVVDRMSIDEASWSAVAMGLRDALASLACLFEFLIT